MRDRDHPPLPFIVSIPKVEFEPLSAHDVQSYEEQDINPDYPRLEHISHFNTQGKVHQASFINSDANLPAEC